LIELGGFGARDVFLGEMAKIDVWREEGQWNELLAGGVLWRSGFFRCAALVSSFGRNDGSLVGVREQATANATACRLRSMATRGHCNCSNNGKCIADLPFWDDNQKDKTMGSVTSLASLF
jgi:hypothetical protein